MPDQSIPQRPPIAAPLVNSDLFHVVRTGVDYRLDFDTLKSQINAGSGGGIAGLTADYIPVALTPTSIGNSYLRQEVNVVIIENGKSLKSEDYNSSLNLGDGNYAQLSNTGPSSSGSIYVDASESYINHINGPKENIIYANDVEAGATFNDGTNQAGITLNDSNALLSYTDGSNASSVQATVDTLNFAADNYHFNVTSDRVAVFNGSSNLVPSTVTTTQLNALSSVSGTIATTSYVDAAVVGLWDDRGTFSAAGGAYPSSGGSGSAGAILKGDIWTISVAGTLPTGQVVEIGDTVRALINSPGNVQANWAIGQNNIGFVPENFANKDTTNGYVGLTSWKINFRNLLNTFTSFFQNSNTAARTYTFQDRNGTIADDIDLALKANLASPTFSGTVSVPTAAAGTNTTQAASTAFVVMAIANASTLVRFLASDQTTTLSTAVDVTAIVFPVAANKKYDIDIIVSHGCSSTGGTKYAITGPAGATMNVRSNGELNSATAFTTSRISTSGALTSAFNTIGSPNLFVTFRGTITTGATAGNFQLQFASTTAGQTSTIFSEGTCAKLTPLT